MLYDFSTSKLPDSHRELFPFELHRHQHLVLGLADGRSRPSANSTADDASTVDGNVNAGQLSEYHQNLDDMYPQALAVQVLVFDHDAQMPLGHAIGVPPKDRSRSTTIKTVMCDVSARLLAEMAVFARTVQSDDGLSAPVVTQAGAPVPFLMRHDTLRDTASRHGSTASIPSRPGTPDRRFSDDVVNEDARARRASSPIPPRSQTPVAGERDQSSAASELSPPRALPAVATDGKRRQKDSPLSRIRNTSRNRSSIHGLPTMSSSEKAKTLTPLRQGLVIGNLYLLAGRWPDALRELVDNATRAKAYSDHMWYAKGMENILATMILLAWARVEFTIPSICFSFHEKFRASKHIPSSDLVRTSQSIDSSDGTISRTLSNLTLALPEMVNSIVQHYLRVDGVDGSALQQYPFSECVIRLSYTLAVLQRTEGQLSDKTARFLVIGSPNAISFRQSQRGLGQGNLHNADIAGLVFQAFPPESVTATMPVDQIVTIMSGVISVLSMARLYRKRAMIIREALSLLIPRLIQARKVGAAEMGIHPAASLAARHGLTIDASSGAPILGKLQNDIDFHDLLVVLCETFGVIGLNELSNRDRTAVNENRSESASTDKFELESKQRNFGGFDLKQEILRLCANFSESVPNFHDVIQFTSALLHTAGPGSAPATDSAISPIQLAPEDQTRFISKMNRTLGVFRSEDAPLLESEYWDPFLVRDVGLNASETAVVFKTSGQLQRISRIRNDEVPATTSTEGARATTTTAATNTLIAEETTDLLITLQNLYDFEIFVESLRIVAEGVEVHSSSLSCVILPRSLQQASVRLVAHQPGQLKIQACQIKIQGCREQSFNIFSEPWKPKQDVKIKSHGLKSLHDFGADVLDPSDRPPQPQTRTLQVVPSQPRLVATSAPLEQAPIDIFQGETKPYSLTVKNVSKQDAINFLYVSLDCEYDKDKHIQRPTSATASYKNWTEPIKWRDDTPLPPIAPGASAVLDFNLEGQLGLQRATFRIDHGHLNDEEIAADSISTYNRRLLIPVNFSIQPSIRLENIQVLSKAQLVAFDILNVSTSSLIIDVTYHSSSHTPPQQPTETGQSTRILLPLNTLTASSIPNLHATWHEPTSNRHGSIQLDPSSISALLAALPKKSPVEVELAIVDASDHPLPLEPRDHFYAPLQRPFTFRCVARNTSNVEQRVIVDFTPRAAGSASKDAEGETARSLAVTGSMRQGALLEAGGEKDMRLALQAYEKGSFEVVADVTVGEETRTEICVFEVV